MCKSKKELMANKNKAAITRHYFGQANCAVLVLGILFFIHAIAPRKGNQGKGKDQSLKAP